jgi:hypothetical protein
LINEDERQTFHSEATAVGEIERLLFFAVEIAEESGHVEPCEGTHEEHASADRKRKARPGLS